ncbi:MAG: dihydrolipoyl dehydrogenase [Thermoprotei archaeon]
MSQTGTVLGEKIEEKEYDVIYIGGGPGGYAGALKSVSLGQSVALIEESLMGGTCVNWGCIPNKSLLASTEAYLNARDGAQYGVDINGDVRLDFSKAMARKDEIVAKLREGVTFMLQSAGVKIYRGRGRLVGERKVKIESGEDAGKILIGKAVVVATGSSPSRPPIKGIDGKNVINSQVLLSMKEQPKSLIIAGAGPEGLELGTFLAACGVHVTVVEMMPHILPLEDADIANALQDALSEEFSNIEFHTGAKVLEIKDSGDLKEVVADVGNGKTESYKAEYVMMSIGRTPNTANLGLEDLGVQFNRRFIKVDNHLRTNLPWLYAIGDAAGGGLAHVALVQGPIAALNAAGHEAIYDDRALPRSVYTFEEVASVGLTEEQAKNKGIKYKVARAFMAANGRALSLGKTHGFIKIIADENNRIIGATMLGPYASEVIQELAAAITFNATLEQLATVIHGHPTVSEVIADALKAGAQ